MGFRGGRTTLSRRKDGKYTNSTKTCEVLLGNDGSYYEAYSYAEKIVKVDFKNEIVIYNVHNFSPTTNGHQEAVRGFFSRQYPTLKAINIDCYSMNNLDIRDVFESIKGLSGLKYTYGLDELVKILGSNRKDLAWVYRLIEADAKKEKERKESKNREIRVKNLTKKLENLDYKDEKSLLKAIEKFKVESTSRRKVEILSPTRWETVEKFKTVLDENNFTLDLTYWNRDRLSLLNGPADYLEAELSKIDGLDLRYITSVDENTAGVFLKHFNKFTCSGRILDKLKLEAQKIVAVQVFSDLGSVENE